MKKRNWTKEEIDYLEDKWGVLAIPGISKTLNRSINAVKLKAQKLGLGRHLHSGEHITLNQFLNEIGRPYGASYTKKQWIEKGLPVKQKRSVNQSFKIIYLDEFWKWAEENRMLIDFSKLEENILGAEPDWVKDQRKADIAAARYKITPWTKEEDALLVDMLNAYKYSYREISVRLGRTEGAIKRRMGDLKLRQRPIKADNHTPWTTDETKILIEMYHKGYRAEVIADKIPRSASAIRGKIERMIKEGQLEPRMKCRKTC